MVTTLSSLCRAKPSSARKPTPQSGPGCQVCLIPPSINICVCLLVGGWKGEVDTERPWGHPCLKSFFSKWNVKGRHACMSMVWCYLCLFVGFSQGHGLRVLSLERKGQMLVRSCLGDDIADRFYQRDSRSFKKKHAFSKTNGRWNVMVWWRKTEWEFIWVLIALWSPTERLKQSDS